MAGNGLSAPRSGCAPASNCIETETTNRAPFGQKAPEFFISILLSNSPSDLSLEAANASPMMFGPSAIAEPKATLVFRKQRRDSEYGCSIVIGNLLLKSLARFLVALFPLPKKV